MTAAFLLKIDTCPMEGILPAEYDKLLEVRYASGKIIQHI